MSGLRVEERSSFKSPRRRRSAVAFLSFGLVVLMTQSGQGAPATNPLGFFRNYFGTIGHVVYSVPLKGTGSGGFATSSFTVPALPQNAQPVAAFLYWATVVQQTDVTAGTVGAEFRGQSISGVAKVLNPQGTSPCWSSGGAAGGGGDAKRLVTQRADVLQFFNQNSENGFVVAGPHSVKLPDSGNGNNTPFTLGASLLIFFRSPTEPFRGITIYDGGFSINQATDTLTQQLQGFYQASTSDPDATVTMIVGDGQDNFSEVVQVSDNLQPSQTVVATNPFVNGWDSLTFSMPLSLDAASATLTISHGTDPNYDCLTGGVFILQTSVQDTDFDGLLDKWELGTAGLDPTGQPLPNLAAMNADPMRKDLFVEVGYLWAQPDTSWGTGSAKVTDTVGHSHLPPKEAVINVVGQAFINAPVKNPDENCGSGQGQLPCGPTGIMVHFDVGNNYQDSPYVVPAAHARGGEAILEKACVSSSTVVCQFPDYPGTFGYRYGFDLLKYAPVANNGGQLSPDDETACEASGTCRRRFDRNRKDMFHYMLAGHFLGIGKSEDPANPLYHVPVTNSGIGDKPGGDFATTLAAFGNGFIGPDSVNAYTIMHEVGHNLWRGHSGDVFAPFENNCNPQFLSLMNYNYQMTGLKDAVGVPWADFSRRVHNQIDEDSLPAGLGVPMFYRHSWYAPRSGVHVSLQTTAVNKHCDGTPLSLAEEQDRASGGGYVRVNGTGIVTPPIDWNGDLNLTNDVGISQDVTFNGVVNDGGAEPAKLLKGSDDWSFIASLGLRQLGSRRSPLTLSLDVGRDGVGRDGVGRDGVGRDGVGSPDFGGLDDLGRDGVGRDGVGRDGVGQEVNFETATAFVHPPHTLKAAAGVNSIVITFKQPGLKTGAVTVLVYRVDGGAPIPIDAFNKRVFIGETAAETITDPKVTGGKMYTYFAVTKAPNGDISDRSNTDTVTMPKK